MKSIFDGILTAKEAAEKYRLSYEYVRTVVRKGRLLKPGRDYCLKGNTWLVSDAACEKVWGHRLITVEAGFRICRKCRTIHPETEEFFAPYRTPTSSGLMHICRGCEQLQTAAWFQRNKKRLRPQRTEYMHDYRKNNPKREAATIKRYRLKRSLRGAGLII